MNGEVHIFALTLSQSLYDSYASKNPVLQVSETYSTFMPK